jgi:photoactive yellow protein
LSTTDRLPEERVFDLTREELDSLPYGVITLDRRGRIQRYNYTEAKFARRTTKETVGLDFFTDVAPCTNVQAFKGRFDTFAQGHGSGVERFDFTFAFRWGHQDVSITLLRKADHDEINLIVRGRTQATLDVAPLPGAEALGLAEPTATESYLPSSGVGVHEIDCGSAWDLASPQEAEWRATIHPDDAASTLRSVGFASAHRKPYGIEYRVVGADGKERVFQEYGSFGTDAAAPGHATVIDVTEHRRLENELWRAGRYDRLTGLPNRALFLDRIAEAVQEVGQSGRVAAVLAFVVTGFDALKATFGHAIADELLRLAALRLGESLFGGDCAARLTSDSIGVLLTGVEDVETVAARARRTLESLYQPFSIGRRVHHLAVRLGISLTPRNGSDATALLQAAETAMAAASRREAPSRIAWFSSEMSAAVTSDLHAEDELRNALAGDEFVLYYQPIVDIRAARIAAVEALLRWNHPRRGLVMPADFIPVAERTGLIAALGDWALREACRQVRRWLDLGIEVRVCVNVSTVRFRQPTFITLVSSVLAETQIPPASLELEVTESVMIEGFNDVIETLAKLKVTGARLSIDDFGTGYSSLSYLKYFPVDTLKLDRAFVADIVSDSFDRAIAKTVLTLAGELKLDCIAEGVETKEQLDLLRSLGCRLVQGYYFSKPQPPAALADKLWRPDNPRA